MEKSPGEISTCQGGTKWKGCGRSAVSRKNAPWGGGGGRKNVKGSVEISFKSKTQKNECGLAVSRGCFGGGGN